VLRTEKNKGPFLSPHTSALIPQHSVLFMWGNPEKILIIHSGGIGDLLLALPAMRIFRRAFPTSALEMLGRPERLALVAHDLRANALHSIDQAGMAHFYSDDSTLPPRLVTFFSSFGVALLFGKTGGIILAKNLERAGVGRIFFLPSFPPEGLKVHASHFLMEALNKKGIEGKKAFWPLELPEDGQRFVRDFLAAHGVKESERILAIHPGSGSPAKNWLPEDFARVADWAEGRARILLLSGPAEDGARAVRRALKRADPLLADNLPLLHLVSLLKKSRVYLGNDSGITHLAASLAVPTVALFGPTDPIVWGPWFPTVRILQGKTCSAPCMEDPRQQAAAPSPIYISLQEVLDVLISYIG
jgi:heptosyltransferase III